MDANGRATKKRTRVSDQTDAHKRRVNVEHRFFVECIDPNWSRPCVLYERTREKEEKKNTFSSPIDDRTNIYIHVRITITGKIHLPGDEQLIAYEAKEEKIVQKRK